MTTKHVFILGATGYVGGAVLVHAKRVFPSFTFTALVRSTPNFDAVREAGADHILHASHGDLDQIAAAATAADIVINAADSDDLPLTQAILRGMAARGGAPRPILLHTSGTGVVACDVGMGAFTAHVEKVWNDNDEADIRGIDAAQPHREIDLAIFGAGSAVNAYIIAPSTIYGKGDGPVNKLSQQVPGVVRGALTLKKGAYVGPGTNLWNNVHIADLVELYESVLRLALSGTDTSSPYGKFYFGSVGEHSWGDVARRVAGILHAKKLLASADAESVTLDEAPFLKWVSSNSRSKSERGFALGWKPHAKSLEETLEADVEDTLKLL